MISSPTNESESGKDNVMTDQWVTIDVSFHYLMEKEDKTGLVGNQSNKKDTFSYWMKSYKVIPLGNKYGGE